jgi:hypothetical protein
MDQLARAATANHVVGPGLVGLGFVGLGFFGLRLVGLGFVGLGFFGLRLVGLGFVGWAEAQPKPNDRAVASDLLGFTAFSPTYGVSAQPTAFQSNPRRLSPIYTGTQIAVGFCPRAFASHIAS